MSSKSDNVTLSGLVNSFSDSNTKATGPFSALFKELGAVSIVLEVLVMYAICTGTYVFVKGVRVLFKDWSKSLYKPRLMEQYWVNKCLKVTTTPPLQTLISFHEPLFSGPYSTWSERQIVRIEELTLDGLVFLLFTRACVQMMFCWVAGSVFLMNIDFSYNLEKDPSIANITIFGTSANCSLANNANDTASSNCQDGMLKYLTIQNIEGSTLYYHIAVVYANLLITFFVIIQYCRLVNRLRTIFLKGNSRQSSSRQQEKAIAQGSIATEVQTDRRWILILGDHKDALSQLSVPFKSVAGESFEIKDCGDIIEETQNYNESVEKLEVTIHEVAASFAKQMFDAERWAKIQDHLEDLKSSPIRTIATAQIQVKTEHYHYLVFETNDLARIAFYKLREQIPDALPKEECMACPDVKDLLWPNISVLITGLVSAKRLAFDKISSILSILFIVFYGLVMVALSFLSSLQAWIKVFPNVGKLAAWEVDGMPVGSALTTVLTSLLPSLLASGFRFILPKTVMVLVNLRMPSRFSERDNTVVLFLFGCLIFVNLFLFTCSNVVFTFASGLIAAKTAKEAAAQTADVPLRLVQGYIRASDFWLTWLPSTSFSSLVAHLQFPRLFSTLSMKWRSREATPRERRGNFGPDPAFPMPERASNFLLIVAVASVYASIAPFVVLVATPAVLVESLLADADLSHLYVYSGDGGGLMWPGLIHCLLFSTCGIQVFMLLAVVGRADGMALLASCPLVLFCGLFWIHLVYDLRYLVVAAAQRRKYRFASLMQSFEFGNHADNFVKMLDEFERAGPKMGNSKSSEKSKRSIFRKNKKEKQLAPSEQAALGIPSYRSSLSDRLLDITISAKAAYAFADAPFKWRQAFVADGNSVLCVEWPTRVSEKLAARANEIFQFAVQVETVKIYDGRADRMQ